MRDDIRGEKFFIRHLLHYSATRSCTMQDMDRTIASGNTIKLPIAQMRPHLIVLYPQNQFKQIPLEKGTVILGRGQDADIRMDDELVSRKHCALTFDGVNVSVRDLGSTNGTFVDGTPIGECKLEDHNRLQIGKMVLKVDFKDASEEAFDRELYEAATMDPLTKISNRRTFMDRSLGELALARRNNYYIHAIMVDADHFKRVNDTYGHDNGDVVLRHFGELINRYVDARFIAGRFGGEEFILLFDGMTAEEAYGLLDRLRREFGEIRYDFCKESVTFSSGIVTITSPLTFKKMFTLVDQALYHSKENGRNQITVGQNLSW